MMFNPEKDEYDPQKVVVRLVEESGLGSLEQFLGDYGVEKIERARGGRSKRTFVVTFSGPVNVKKLVVDLRGNPGVEDASPEFVRRLA